MVVFITDLNRFESDRGLDGADDRVDDWGECAVIVGAARQGVCLAVFSGGAVFDGVRVAVQVLGPSYVAGK